MDSNQPRRIFLQHALATVGVTLSASALTAILTSCEKDESQPIPPVDPTTISIKLSDYPALTGAGTITTGIVDGINDGNLIFISQVAAEKFAVFSAICTHAGCPVGVPEVPGEDCLCPCHRSMFSPVDGKVTRGPALTNLKTFAATFNAASGILSVHP